MWNSNQLLNLNRILKLSGTVPRFHIKFETEKLETDRSIIQRIVDLRKICRVHGEKSSIIPKIWLLISDISPVLSHCLYLAHGKDNERVTNRARCPKSATVYKTPEMCPQPVIFSNWMLFVSLFVFVYMLKNFPKASRAWFRISLKTSAKKLNLRSWGVYGDPTSIIACTRRPFYVFTTELSQHSTNNRSVNAVKTS